VKPAEKDVLAVELVLEEILRRTGNFHSVRQAAEAGLHRVAEKNREQVQRMGYIT
jgi:hypothetical protein